MKTIAQKKFCLLGVALLFGLLAVGASAAEKDSKDSPAKTGVDHGIKIASHAGAKVDKLATLLTQHAKSAMGKAEHAVSHVAKRAEQVGHKAEVTAKKTVHKVGEKIEKLTE